MTRLTWLIFAAAVAASSLATQAQEPGRAEAAASAADIEILPVRGTVSMLASAAGNVVVQTGDEGVLVVDALAGAGSASLLRTIRTLSTGPVRYIVNTHLHADHIGGNDDVAREGRTRAGGNVVGNIGADASARATVIAHENVLTRLSAPTGSQSAVPFSLWPTETFFTGRKDFLFNGEAVQVIHQPNAHTDGDVLVFFRRADVVAAGDVFSTVTFPVIDTANGGHINGVIAALNRIIDIAVPSNVEEGGTMIVPGHGRLCDEWEVVEYRDMVTIVRDRVSAMVKAGMTLAQVRAAQPTFEYDARYGTGSGPGSTAGFVDAVYRGLSTATGTTRPPAR
jgi:cyclase